MNRANNNLKRGSILDEKSGLCSCEQGNKTDSLLTKRTTSLPDLSLKDKRASLKIGIVIPIYNVAPYLRECLDSVIAQTYGNFEVCLVNDGSTDILDGEAKSESVKIAREYVAKDERFVLIEKENGGQSSARNAGIDYFGGGNLSLGIHSADLLNFGRSQTPSLVSRPKFSKNYESNTANTSIVCNDNNLKDLSLRGARSEASATKQSKTRESNPQQNTMIEKEIDELDLHLQHYDSYNLDSRVLDCHDFADAKSRNDDFVASSRNLDSSLRALHFAQNDEVKNSPSLAEGVRGWVKTTLAIQNTHPLCPPPQGRGRDSLPTTHNDKHDFMTFYTHPNNANLNAPKIDYIIFLDSDDFWESDLLESCVRLAQNTKNLRGSIVSEKSGLRSHEQGNRTNRPLTKQVASLPDLSPQDNAPPDIIWFNWRESYESKTPPNPHSQTMLELFGYTNQTQITAIEWLNRAKDRQIYQFWWAWQGLIRFETLQKIHLRFLEGIIFEDNLFGILLFSQCESIAILPRKLYNYRIRWGSTTTTKNAKTLPPFVEPLRGEFGDLAWEYFCAFSLCEMTFALDSFCENYANKRVANLCKANFLPHFLAQSCDILRFKRDICGTKARFKGLLKKEHKNLQILQIISFIAPRAFKGVRYFLFLLCIKPRLAIFRAMRKIRKILGLYRG